MSAVQFGVGLAGVLVLTLAALSADAPAERHLFVGVAVVASYLLGAFR